MAKCKPFHTQKEIHEKDNEPLRNDYIKSTLSKLSKLVVFPILYKHLMVQVGSPDDINAFSFKPKHVLPLDNGRSLKTYFTKMRAIQSQRQ